MTAGAREDSTSTFPTFPGWRTTGRPVVRGATGQDGPVRESPTGILNRGAPGR
ncbi:hypothetical protein NORO109296_17135 [Nocardiopsis rhodophaea]